MLRPGGFPEFSPAEQMIFDDVKQIVENSYQKFGYAHIHTPAVEANKVLLAKSGPETGKQIFGLYGLAQGAEDLKEYSLHFDLTIPFARYVLDREGELVFPFKRYQVQTVWRGERQQRGRFREFWQCDIDTVWHHDQSAKMGFYDAETLVVLGSTLSVIQKKYFPQKTFTVHYNHRGLMYDLFGNYEKREELYQLFDKYYKIGHEKFEQELDLLLLSSEAEEVRTFLAHPQKNEVLKEIEKYLQAMDPNHEIKFVYDPFIMRGLDYYTGMVFEVFFDDDMSLGSISSGGRYENLTTHIDPKRNFSGVGGSIGISRLVALILEQEKFLQQSPADMLCVHFDETFDDICMLAETLRNQGKKVEIYPFADKLGKQFAYADKKGISQVVILGEGEKKEGIYKVKTMATGEEQIEKAKG